MMNSFEHINNALRNIRRLERLREIATDWLHNNKGYYQIFINRIESLESLQYRVLEELIELTKKEKS